MRVRVSTVLYPHAQVAAVCACCKKCALNHPFSCVASCHCLRYQVCLFCYQRINNEYTASCPGCRQPYGADNDAVKAHVKKRQEQAQREAAAQQQAATAAAAQQRHHPPAQPSRVASQAAAEHRAHAHVHHTHHHPHAPRAAAGGGAHGRPPPPPPHHAPMPAPQPLRRLPDSSAAPHLRPGGAEAHAGAAHGSTWGLSHAAGGASAARHVPVNGPYHQQQQAQPKPATPPSEVAWPALGAAAGAATAPRAPQRQAGAASVVGRQQQAEPSGRTAVARHEDEDDWPTLEQVQQQQLQQQLAEQERERQQQEERERQQQLERERQQLEEQERQQREERERLQQLERERQEWEREEQERQQRESEQLISSQAGTHPAFSSIEVTSVVAGVRKTVNVPVSAPPPMSPHPEAVRLLEVMRQAVQNGSITPAEAAMQLVSALRRLESGVSGGGSLMSLNDISHPRDYSGVNSLASRNSSHQSLHAAGNATVAPFSSRPSTAGGMGSRPATAGSSGPSGRPPPPGFGGSVLKPLVNLGAAAAGSGAPGALQPPMNASQSSMRSVDSSGSLMSQGSAMQQPVWTDSGLPGLDFGGGSGRASPAICAGGLSAAVPPSLQLLWGAGIGTGGAGAGAVGGVAQKAPPPGFASTGAGGSGLTPRLPPGFGGAAAASSAADQSRLHRQW